jgi:hypothetical protein
MPRRMGIAGSWVHVDRSRLEEVLAKPEWNARELEASLKANGASDEEIVDLVYYGHEEPHPNWNSSLERITAKASFSLDKMFPGPATILGTVAKVLPGARPLIDWTLARRPAVPLSEPWKSTDIVGFEVVASAEQVREVLAAVAPFRDRKHCAVFARENAGALPELLNPKRRALRLWVEDDHVWAAWEQTLAALDAVAASQRDYLGFSTG